MQKTVDVFILAAGESSRMFPLNHIMEKSMLPIDGKPVIRHIYDKLWRAWDSIDDACIGKIVICCLEKFKKQFEHEFDHALDLNVEIIDFPKPIGTYNTFREALLRRNANTTRHVIIHYADCLTDINYSHLLEIQYFKNRGRWDGLIAVTRNIKHDYSEVRIQGDDIEDKPDEDFKHIIPEVHSFSEKPKLERYSWSGIGIFHTENLLNLYHYKRDGITDFALDIFPQMIERGTLRAYPYTGYWYDCGNLNSYRKLCEIYGNNKEQNLSKL